LIYNKIIVLYTTHAILHSISTAIERDKHYSFKHATASKMHRCTLYALKYSTSLYPRRQQRNIRLRASFVFI